MSIEMAGPGPLPTTGVSAPPDVPPAAEAAAPFRVLFVCTANICRSPLAEHLLRWELDHSTSGLDGSRWDVRSAGTHAAVGTKTHPMVLEALAEQGIEVDPIAARPLSRPLLDGADLVLTMTRVHRTDVVDVAPEVVRRTFTVRQFARWCQAARRTGVDRPVLVGDDLLEVARAGQSHLQPVTRRDDDISDPIGLGIQAFRHCRDLTARAIATMLMLPEES